MEEMQELIAQVGINANALIYCTICNHVWRILSMQAGQPKFYFVQARTSPSEGPFSIGSVIHLHCDASPEPPSGSTYQWRTSVPGVTITHRLRTDPNATITIHAGHTKYGYYCCQIQDRGSTLGTGFTAIEVKRELNLDC